MTGSEHRKPPSIEDRYGFKQMPDIQPSIFRGPKSYSSLWILAVLAFIAACIILTPTNHEGHEVICVGRKRQTCYDKQFYELMHPRIDLTKEKAHTRTD